MRLGGLFLCEEISNRVGVKNASSEKEKCSPMEDDDDDNDASDRASFFSPMLSRLAAARAARGGIGRSARVAVGRSVRRSERRSAFPCFSYFMIPKREWERIDYNDGHQATTIEQKKYGYLCMPHCRMPPPLQAEPYAGGTLVSQIDYSVRLFFFKIVSTLYRPLGITV